MAEPAGGLAERSRAGEAGAAPRRNTRSQQALRRGRGGRRGRSAVPVGMATGAPLPPGAGSAARAAPARRGAGGGGGAAGGAADRAQLGGAEEVGSARSLPWPGPAGGGAGGAVLCVHSPWCPPRVPGVPAPLVSASSRSGRNPQALPPGWLRCCRASDGFGAAAGKSSWKQEAWPYIFSEKAETGKGSSRSGAVTALSAGSGGARFVWSRRPGNRTA